MTTTSCYWDTRSTFILYLEFMDLLLKNLFLCCHLTWSVSRILANTSSYHQSVLFLLLFFGCDCLEDVAEVEIPSTLCHVRMQRELCDFKAGPHLTMIKSWPWTSSLQNWEWWLSIVNQLPSCGGFCYSNLKGLINSVCPRHLKCSKHHWGIIG